MRGAGVTDVQSGVIRGKTEAVGLANVIGHEGHFASSRRRCDTPLP